MATNKTNNVVVFGGTSGVGLATAKLALTHLPNSNIVISSSQQTKIDATLAELDKLKPAHRSDIVLAGTPADLSDSTKHLENLENVLKFAVDKFHGPINHIVYTAGNFPGMDTIQAGLEGRSNDDVLAVLSTRVLAPMTIGILAKKYMSTDDRRSSITLTTGGLGYHPNAGQSRFAPVAIGVEGTVRGLAVDLAPLRVNGVILGPVHTPLLEGMAPKGSEAAENLVKSTLVGSIAEAEEVAEAFLYCMRCAYVDGTMIWCDGGLALKK